MKIKPLLSRYVAYTQLQSKYTNFVLGVFLFVILPGFIVCMEAYQRNKCNQLHWIDENVFITDSDNMLIV